MQLRLAGEKCKPALSWRVFREQTGLSKGMAQRTYSAQKGAPSLPKNRCGHIPWGVRVFLRTPCDRCAVPVL